jgi:hypothetical protein
MSYWQLSLLVCQLFAVCCLAVSGCAAIEDQMVERELEDAISKYNLTAPQVSLGDSKERVLAVLEPTQQGLRGKLRRPPEAFTTEQGTTEIYYFRSAWMADGQSTDDEFTPYVFKNARLTSIGWQALGGPKTMSGR